MQTIQVFVVELEDTSLVLLFFLTFDIRIFGDADVIVFMCLFNL